MKNMENYKRINFPNLKFEYIIYKDGSIYNKNSKKFVHPFKDPRRPTEPPIIYLKCKNGRKCIYHNELMAMTFIPFYDSSRMCIKYKDKNLMNCSLDNLIVGDGEYILKNFYHETKEWKCINLKYKLYYEYYICEDGRLFNGTTGAFIQPFKDTREKNKGYLRYNLYTSKSVKDTVHMSASRLVAEFFIPQPIDKNIVIFIDDDNSNINKNNLYWGDNYDLCCKHIEYDRELTSIETCLVGKEKWKPIKFDDVLEDEYIVSSYGRVYNNTRKFYLTQSKGHLNLNNQGYKSVYLKLMNGTRKKVFVHRLVGLAFIKNPDPIHKIFINHINGNPECNIAINLEWTTPYENMYHAIGTNLVHNSKFIGIVNDKNWRLNTLYAWITSIPNINKEQIYSFYTEYLKRFQEDIPLMNEDEFFHLLKYKEKHDNDYIQIKKFYTEYLN